ncbi:hypothetical protein FOMPIDRAFT_1132490 [Fomitopsis schrenkii]|uniref:U6 small nuclear RNA (adenine-(43)-N(6))-methyltransferase n=1 Tax=Fomitopsis schrenkii TaxID=2126942 RepID=S8FA18_FOMSC|nr:hypothetical protein FOMPIDRAFT_1132490 [Fomitopsis schrenkii]
MHPRNPYRSAPEFRSLADAYPPLQPYLLNTRNGASIDFQDEAAQSRRLTEAILLRDFKLTIDIPEDRLCPPVPNRLNYILWLQDVLDVTCLTEHLVADRTIRGVDVGTGASAIYPLLGCRSDPRWVFVATDIDERSLEYAQRNVRRNDLYRRISVVRSDPAGPILSHVLSEHSSISVFDFTMCNPPFYSSKEDVQRSAETKEYQPNAVCTGADVEMITSGGEVAFVRKMVRESLELRSRCRWFTSMLGRLSSLAEIIALLREHQIDNYAVTEFVQGQTRRWAIAWSFGDVHLPDAIARISNPSVHSLMPAHNTVQQVYPEGTSLEGLLAAVASALATIDGVSFRPLKPRPPHSSPLAPCLDALVSATGDTWSRAARRRRMREETMEVDREAAPTLVCRVICATHMGGGSEGAGLQCHWVRGRDRGLFGSFASHLSRKVYAALSTSSQE